MSNAFFIRPSEQILQIDGRVYKIPSGSRLHDFTRDTRVKERVIELAEIYGVQFCETDQEINCRKCRYAGNSRSSKNRQDADCSYNGIVERINVFQSRDTANVFMARDPPCVLKDAFYLALLEKGYLAEFVLEGVEPIEFPDARDFVRGGELEMQAAVEYERLRKEDFMQKKEGLKHFQNLLRSLIEKNIYSQTSLL